MNIENKKRYAKDEIGEEEYNKMKKSQNVKRLLNAQILG